MKHLDLKMENLEAAAEQAPKDLDYISIANWLESCLYHLVHGV